ncbi:hypothetical protein AMTRI_Chr08g166010 [Amborella trichopoda]
MAWFRGTSNRGFSSWGHQSLLMVVELVTIVLLCCMTVYSFGEVQTHNFIIQSTRVTRLCKTINVITVNGQLPGPTLEVNNGDTLIINAVNRARYNVTLHWHGIRQIRTGWADGPEFVTQCPIRPGGSYTYRFTIENQEGTLWWHAHSSWLRATVYGALIIHPKPGASYPFTKPKREAPIILGEWWNRNPIDVVNQATRTGAAPNISDAYTINGQPGDLYNCSSKDTVVIPVASGETNLFRIINAALNAELFFKIANHKFTVVAVDASYTKPYTTDVLMIAPGQTTDLLVTADQAPGRYYIAARAYASNINVAFDNTTTTAILQYQGLPCPAPGTSAPQPIMPSLPFYNDTNTATRFTTSLRSLNSREFPARVPQSVDENLFFTVGLGLFNCRTGQMCGGPNNTRFAASVNNISFALPQSLSILQAHTYGVNGVFTRDFPRVPPVQFDYTAQNVSRALWQPVRGTRVKQMKFGSVVQVVLQGTNIVNGENHPMHLHGHDFYVLAEGFGNFNPSRDTSNFNLVDPPLRNTMGVPINGWAVIRFVADNPGVWLMHCHFDVHINWGLAMVFLVENGISELESLEPPPIDLPPC